MLVVMRWAGAYPPPICPGRFFSDLATLVLRPRNGADRDGIRLVLGTLTIPRWNG